VAQLAAPDAWQPALSSLNALFGFAGGAADIAEGRPGPGAFRIGAQITPSVVDAARLISAGAPAGPSIAAAGKSAVGLGPRFTPLADQVASGMSAALPLVPGLMAVTGAGPMDPVGDTTASRWAFMGSMLAPILGPLAPIGGFAAGKVIDAAFGTKKSLKERREREAALAAHDTMDVVTGLRDATQPGLGLDLPGIDVGTPGATPTDALRAALDRANLVLWQPTTGTAGDWDRRGGAQDAKNAMELDLYRRMLAAQDELTGRGVTTDPIIYGPPELRGATGFTRDAGPSGNDPNVRMTAREFGATTPQDQLHGGTQAQWTMAQMASRDNPLVNAGLALLWLRDNPQAAGETGTAYFNRLLAGTQQLPQGLARHEFGNRLNLYGQDRDPRHLAPLGVTSATADRLLDTEGGWRKQLWADWYGALPHAARVRVDQFTQTGERDEGILRGVGVDPEIMARLYGLATTQGPGYADHILPLRARGFAV
jgi:hypothetical protein